MPCCALPSSFSAACRPSTRMPRVFSEACRPSMLMPRVLPQRDLEEAWRICETIASAVTAETHYLGARQERRLDEADVHLGNMTRCPFARMAHGLAEPHPKPKQNAAPHQAKLWLLAKFTTAARRPIHRAPAASQRCVGIGFFTGCCPCGRCVQELPHRVRASLAGRHAKQARGGQRHRGRRCEPSCPQGGGG